MGNQILKITRILVFILVLPTLAIFLSPLNKVSADCPGTANQLIKVDNGLISAVDPRSFEAKENVSCVTGESAKIQPFSIQSYDEMKTLYFDQARSTFIRIPLTGNQTQSTPAAILNLSTLE